MFGKEVGALANNYIPEREQKLIRARLGERDKKIFDLLICTGYRLDDVLRLRNWQLKGNTINVKERKTGNFRTVENPCRQSRGKPLEYVFKGRGRTGEKKKLHRSTFWRHFERAVRAAGLEDRGYTVHSLRKVYAVNRYRATGDIKAVQADLGHKSLATTCLYVLGALQACAPCN